MARDFGTLHASQLWRRDVADWIQSQTRARGITVAPDPQTFRVRPWSVLMTAASDAGVLWFKASCEAMAYEPALQQVLAELAPETVDAPIAIDTDRAWMLTLEHPRPLAETQRTELSDWLDTVTEMISLQQQLMPHRERLLATGMPDCAPDTVLDRFDRLVVLMSKLPESHPSRLDQSDRAALTHARQGLAEAVNTLVSGPLGSSWQHGDVHGGNVYRTERGLRIFDFGDSQWAHALESLVVPHSIVNEEQPTWWQQIQDLCVEAWGLHASDFHDLWQAARRTQAVNRASTWHALSENLSVEAFGEWSPAARIHLMRLTGV